MKQLTFTAIIISLLLSCSRIDSNKSENKYNDISVIDEEVVYKDFAVILSRAVSNEPSLREFIRNEALRQFDRDYDVFYPWVKNVNVDNRTFRDILLSYDYEGMLDIIENEAPMLNILVPDWSWIDRSCFSVRTWDTSNNYVGVSYRTSGNNQIVFSNGRIEDLIEKNVVPSYPMLIVKNNERMVLKSAPTKGCLDKNDYELYDDAFANTDEPATKDSWGNPWYITVDTDPDSEYLPASILQGRVSTAYNTLYASPRDHIYYGMTASQNTGEIDYNYKETILRIKFNLSNINALYDDSDDFELLGHSKNGKNASYTEDDLKDLIWADGSLEMLFVIKAGDYLDVKPRSISFNEAFQINKFELKNKYNWLGVKKAIYAHIYKEYLVPRWVTLNIPLFTWNISQSPKEYRIIVIERDSGITRTVTESVEENYMQNYTVGISGTFEDLVKIGFNYGGQGTVKRTTTYSYQTTEYSDSLGTLNINYTEAVISDIDSLGMVRPYTQNAGQATIQLLPTRI